MVSNGTLHIIERPPAPPAQPAHPPALELPQLFDEAARLETSDPQQAIALYQRCLELDAQQVEARINCARLLHESGQFDLAERLYRAEACLRDADAMFNLGVLLEDTGRSPEAIDSYLAAIALDPGLADAHYNLARLYEIAGNDPHMIRHLRQYRTLVSAPPAP